MLSLCHVAKPGRISRKIVLLRPCFVRYFSSAETDDPVEARGKIIQHKRHQQGQTFLDYLVVDIRAGKGGDGAVAFHREKFKPNGPPAGGNGGQGGNVFLRCDPSVSSLAGISKLIRAAKGSKGLGTWRHGKNAADTFVSVPVGTIVRQVNSAKTKEEVEEESMHGLSKDERHKKKRALRWVHYPLHTESNEGSEWFQEAEATLVKEEKAEERARIREREERSILAENDEDGGLYLDLTHPTPAAAKGHIVAAGGAGGYGNPHFMTLQNRSPKWATRGKEGTWITLELELKLLADIGLVGFPNAGKSTVLRALTRSQAEVAPYAFTTLNPQVGTVRVWENGVYDDGLSDVVEDSVEHRRRMREEMESGALASSHSALSDRLGKERHRFTIADNPGLIARASENVGLGHSFLRSIERSLALVYVVDLSGDAPWDELRTLKHELETYKPGLSGKARMVLANKADLVVMDEGDEEAVLLAKEKLEKLKRVVSEEMGGCGGVEGSVMDVVPVSGKFKVNLELAVEKMADYVNQAREAEAANAVD